MYLKEASQYFGADGQKKEKREGILTKTTEKSLDNESKWMSLISFNTRVGLIS